MGGRRTDGRRRGFFESEMLEEEEGKVRKFLWPKSSSTFPSPSGDLELGILCTQLHELRRKDIPLDAFS